MKYAFLVLLGLCSLANPSFARGGVSGGGGTDDGRNKIVAESLKHIWVTCGSSGHTIEIEKSRLVVDLSAAINEACQHPENEMVVGPESL